MTTHRLNKRIVVDKIIWPRELIKMSGGYDDERVDQVYISVFGR